MVLSQTNVPETAQRVHIGQNSTGQKKKAGSVFPRVRHTTGTPTPAEIKFNARISSETGKQSIQASVVFIEKIYNMIN